ncbi:MAG: DUF1622 domain-containing protein [Clostridia bacterium]|nr:DUF1622 domain-containing protein [Clostridia bacterium]
MLRFVAECVVYSLELVGILIIVIGSIKALLQVFTRIKKKKPLNVMISLGKSLSLALEFKMGAEIINTVIVRDLKELGILAIVIIIRALLAILIHWEIKMGIEDDENERKVK